MRNISIIFILAVLWLIACKGNKSKLEYFYFENGSVYQVKEYKSLNDTASFHLIQFYQNGDTNIIGTYRNNMPDGIFRFYHPNNSIASLSRFVNGKNHGVSFEYNEHTKELEFESLFLNGHKLIVGEHSQVFDTLSCVAYYYAFYSENDTVFDFFGSVVKDQNERIVQRMMTYFYVEAPGVIMNGDPYPIDILFQIGLFDDGHFVLTLGEIDENYNFTDSTQLQSYTSEGKRLSFELTDYNIGVNLLLGKIRLYSGREEGAHTIFENSRISEYIFYHQFEVLE